MLLNLDMFKVGNLGLDRDHKTPIFDQLREMRQMGLFDRNQAPPPRPVQQNKPEQGERQDFEYE